MLTYTTILQPDIIRIHTFTTKMIRLSLLQQPNYDMLRSQAKYIHIVAWFLL